MEILCKTQNLEVTPISGLLWEIIKTTFWIVTPIAFGLMVFLLHLWWALRLSF
jgi:hypothetical protein